MKVAIGQTSSNRITARSPIPSRKTPGRPRASASRCSAETIAETWMTSIGVLLSSWRECLPGGPQQQADEQQLDRRAEQQGRCRLAVQVDPCPGRVDVGREERDQQQ